LCEQGRADVACDVYDHSVNDCDLFDFDKQMFNCTADVNSDLAGDYCVYDDDFDHNEFIIPLFIDGVN